MQTDKRIHSLDMARGFTVLLIPVIHSFMIYGNQQAIQSKLGSFLAFIAGWPGAQLFMLHMGIVFSLKQSVTFKTVINRTLFLLLAGYMLNTIKFILLHSIGLLPWQFSADVQVYNKLGLLLIGDIFHFAALALPFMFAVTRLPRFGVISIILLLVICFISPAVWDSSSPYHGQLIKHCIDLFTGSPPQAYFPFFPWIIFPLAGLCIGYYFQCHGYEFFLPLFFIGVVMLLPAFFIPPAAGETFYRTTPWKTLQHLGFVCCWMPCWYVLYRLFKYTKLFTWLSFFGRNITTMYLVQWPLICWLMPFVGYKLDGLLPTCLLGLTVTVITIAITVAMDSIRKHLWTRV